MSIYSDDVRKGMTNATFNEKNSDFLASELMILSIICGVFWQSWWVFGAVLFELIICLQIKKLALILCFVLSILWAVVGYFIGTFFDSLGASVVLALLSLAASLSAHFSALQWFEDLD
jgi:hypothetical protein